MKKFLRWVLPFLAVLVLTIISIGEHYVLDSTKLEETIKRQLPSGSPKAQVIQFVQDRHPVAYDDLGSEVKARLSGLAKNLIYRKDVILTFEIGTDGRLSSWSKKEYLTFF
jgi:hypothetical protein